MDNIVFQAWTFNEITLFLLLSGLLTVPEVIRKRIEFERIIKTITKN